MKTIDAPSWLSLVLPMAWQLRSGNIQIQFEVQFEVEEVEYEVEVAQNVAIVMLSDADVRDALAFVESNVGEALMFALVSTSSEGPAKLQTLKRCDLERVLNALEELPERKYERESCARTFSELANALEANMRKKI